MSAVDRVHTIRAESHLRLVPCSGLSDQIREFLIDREARGLSIYTLTWYRQQLGHLRTFLIVHGIDDVEDITATTLRSFLIDFAQTHNPGGTHGIYRAARAFLNWYAVENEEWRNPFAKVRAPKVPQDPLEPVSLDHLKAMLAACPRRSLLGERDRAIMMFLLDSGCRRGEFLALNVRDVNLGTGAVLVRRGKGSKWRTAFIGAKTRRALLRYLRHRRNLADTDPLWVNEEGQRLSPTALRAVLIRRAIDANVPAPSPHMFRRGFAITVLRNGCNLVTLQRLLGHSDLSTISRYLKHVQGDLAAAHAKMGPVDSML